MKISEEGMARLTPAQRRSIMKHVPREAPPDLVSRVSAPWPVSESSRGDELAEIREDIRHMRQRLEEGQGKRTSPMCRLSLTASERLLSMVPDETFTGEELESLAFLAKHNLMEMENMPDYLRQPGTDYWVALRSKLQRMRAALGEPDEG